MKKIKKKSPSPKSDLGGGATPQVGLGGWAGLKIKAKKSLGQNFLKSNLFLNKIVEAGRVSLSDFVLEIGPGKGALTEKLLEKAKIVLAIEKDKRMVEFLSVKFKKEIEEKKLVLLEEDILNLDIYKTFTSLNLFNSNSLKYKIIANIPYNITGAILKKFLTESHQPELMVLMIQKEVAERIVQNGKKSKESLLSVSVKVYGRPKNLGKVPKRYFSPEPKVDSAILLIEDISKKNFIENKIEEDFFWQVLRIAFGHKRKTLSKNLSSFFDSKNVFQVFDTLNLPKNIRAESLAISKWFDLAKLLKNSSQEIK